MKNLLLLVVTFMLFILIGATNLKAQGSLGVVGKFYTKQEANITFGKVKTSISIKISDLTKALESVKDYVLFTIKNNQVIVRDQKRNSTGYENVKISKNEMLYIFSKSLVLQLLQNSTADALNGGAVLVELRDGVLSLTNGETTLEMSMFCPPICPN